MFQDINTAIAVLLATPKLLCNMDPIVFRFGVEHHALIDAVVHCFFYQQIYLLQLDRFLPQAFQTIRDSLRLKVTNWNKERKKSWKGPKLRNI